MQIRTGMRSSWLAAAAVALATGLLALLPSGCGGGGGINLPGGTPTPVGATPTPAPTPLRTAAFKVKIEWGARSRVTGLSSAQSARITLAGASASGSDITWTVNRPAGTAEVAQVYDAPQQARVGNHLMTIQFYANAMNSDGTGGGDNVGFAQASTSILADGSLTVTISTYTGVQSVSIIEDGVNNTVEVGQTKDLAFTAKNQQGNIVMVTPGSAFFTVVSDTANLGAVNGGSSVKGLHPISAKAVVRVDNATSPAALVNVTSATVVDITPGTVSTGSEYPVDLSATVTGAPSAESDVTWVINEGAGVQNGTLTNVQGNSVRYLAPKVVGTDVRTVTLTATSKYNTTKSKTITITTNAPATVTISPNAADLSWEQSVVLDATVNNLSTLIPAGNSEIRRQVKWEIVKDGNNPVGTLVVDGTNPNRATYTSTKRDAPVTVRAISNYDTTKIGTVVINVSSKVAVDITPKPTTTLNWGDTLDLTATVAQTPNQSVTWTVQSPNGFSSALASTGANTAKFTAPKNDGSYVLRATSNYDSRRFQEITVNVLSQVLVDVNPKPTASIDWEDKVDLTATVVKALDTSVTWSIVSPAGFASRLVATGPTTATFTAPKVNGTYVVRATSNYDPRQFKDVSIIVNTNIGVVTVPDPLADPVKVSINRTQDFKVALTGLPTGRDGTVSWTIVGPNDEPNTGNKYGKIISTGLVTATYTAPGTPPAPAGKLKVIATSNYDTKATKAINVQVIAGSIGIGIK